MIEICTRSHLARQWGVSYAAVLRASDELGIRPAATVNGVEYIEQAAALRIQQRLIQTGKVSAYPRTIETTLEVKQSAEDVADADCLCHGVRT